MYNWIAKIKWPEWHYGVNAWQHKQGNALIIKNTLKAWRLKVESYKYYFKKGLLVTLFIALILFCVCCKVYWVTSCLIALNYLFGIIYLKLKKVFAVPRRFKQEGEKTESL